jgi:hypothetical protein
MNSLVNIIGDDEKYKVTQRRITGLFTHRRQ